MKRLSNLIWERAAVLKIENIQVNYGEFQALQGVSLEVPDKSIVALLGSNGAGKSTTINTVSGTTDLRGGKIIFDGQDISKMSVNERVEMGIIQVPEGRKLFPYMTVMDNLLVGSYSKHARPHREKQLKLCFDLFPKMYERKDQLAGLMSGGEQQMCAVARAIMGCPRLLMFDEPSLGLAPVVVDDVFKTIKELNEQDMTILLVEQNVLLSLKIASYGYVIENGMNTVEGPAQELLGNDDIRKSYLGM